MFPLDARINRCGTDILHSLVPRNVLLVALCVEN
jgi:hypothetical protein